MFVLLPPSETKAPGGDDPPVDLDSLLFPQLRAERTRVMLALSRLSGDPAAARAALKLGPAQDHLIAHNADLHRAPALPALHRYTGVLYEALDAAHFTAAESARARARILIASALFGVVAASDRIPSYRASAGSKLPGIGPIAAMWRRSLAPLVAALSGPVVDLRSGAYAAFGEVPGAITVRVMTVRDDGSRAVVSHFNKATKGRLARLLATTRAEVRGPADVARIARRSGMTVERIGPSALQIVT